MPSASEGAHRQKDRNGWNGEPELLSQDPQAEHPITMPEQEFESLVQRPSSLPRHFDVDIDVYVVAYQHASGFENLVPVEAEIAAVDFRAG